MKTQTEKLADALREIRDRNHASYAHDTAAMRADDLECADKALAEYDAARTSQASRYLVRWEVDSDDETPEEAARAADGNTSRFYTVRDEAGVVHCVDLDDTDGGEG